MTPADSRKGGNVVDTQLTQAVAVGDTAAVADLIGRGAPLNVRDANGLTPIMLAAGRGDARLVQLLLQAGADPLVVTPEAGTTALHLACQGINLGIVRLLIEAGAPVDWVATSTGHTPLLEAIWFKRDDIVEYLLERGATLNRKTRYGLTLDEHFTETYALNQHGRDRLDRIKQLIDARRAADQHATDTQRLMAATVANDLDAVRRALAAGANVNERFPLVDGPNDGHTPLLVACRQGYTAIVSELLGARADVNVVETIFGAVPLHKAVYNGHSDITRLLTEQPGVDLDYQGATNHYTPLHDAIWHGYPDCAEILVRAGARLDLVGFDGKTPLVLSAELLGPDHPLTQLIRARSG